MLCLGRVPVDCPAGFERRVCQLSSCVLRWSDVDWRRRLMQVQRVRMGAVVHYYAARLVFEHTVRAGVACMSPCPRIGLSTYM
jgi:hypothetical protein